MTKFGGMTDTTYCMLCSCSFGNCQVIHCRNAWPSEVDGGNEEEGKSGEDDDDGGFVKSTFDLVHKVKKAMKLFRRCPTKSEPFLKKS